METNDLNTFLPSHPVHPFEILEDEIEARGMTHKEFASQIGMASSNFSRMLKLRGELTSEMALKLEVALGIPYLEWMAYQEAYIKDRLRIDRTSNSGFIRSNKPRIYKPQCGACGIPSYRYSK